MNSLQNIDVKKLVIKILIIFVHQILLSVHEESLKLFSVISEIYTFIHSNAKTYEA